MNAMTDCGVLRDLVSEDDDIKKMTENYYLVNLIFIRYFIGLINKLQILIVI